MEAGAYFIEPENGQLNFYCFSRMDDLKTGTLVGVDKDGNRYFENKKYFYGEYEQTLLFLK